MDALFTSICSGGLCDTIGVWVAALLTILVWSYLLRDTFLFRIAGSLLVGTAVGYVGAVVINTVLWGRLLAPLLNDAEHLFANQWVLFIPLLLGITFLLKLFPNWRSNTVSNLGLAYLFGIGAALAIGGALSGALVPQFAATVIAIDPNGSPADWINGVLIVIGVIGSLLAFRYVTVGARPWQRAYNAVAGAWGRVGRAFIMIAFGALLASLITARVSTLVGQLYFMFHDWLAIIK